MFYFAAHCICIFQEAKPTITYTVAGFGSPCLSPFVRPKKTNVGDGALTDTFISVITLYLYSAVIVHTALPWGLGQDSTLGEVGNV